MEKQRVALEGELVVIPFARQKKRNEERGNRDVNDGEATRQLFPVLGDH